MSTNTPHALEQDFARRWAQREAEEARFPKLHALADASVSLALRNLYAQGSTGDSAYERFDQLCDAVAKVVENADAGDPSVDLKTRLLRTGCADELLAYLCHSLLKYRDQGSAPSTAERSRRLGAAFGLTGRKSKTPTEEQEREIVVAFSTAYGKAIEDSAIVYEDKGRRRPKREDGLIVRDRNRAAVDPKAQRRAREAGYRAAFSAWRKRDYETGTDDQKSRDAIKRVMEKHYPNLLRIDGQES